MNWYKNLSLRAKLLLGFSPVVVIAIIIAIVGWFNISAMNAQSHEIYQERLVPITELGHAQGYLYRTLTSISLINIQHQDNLVQTLHGYEEAIQNSLEQVEATALSDEEQATLDKLQADWSTFKTDLDHFLEQVGL